MTTGGKKDSPRKRGLKQGLFIFLLTFLVVPLLAILSEIYGIEEAFVAISAVLFFMGGIIRMAYALMFESGDYASLQEQNSQFLAMPNKMELSLEKALPSEMDQSDLLQARTQEDLFQLEQLKFKLPASVTEETTMLFETGLSGEKSSVEEVSQTEEVSSPFKESK
ncbi:MAG: hypothetical protein ACK419_03830 [Pyrinomonadaceae bacterium]